MKKKFLLPILSVCMVVALVSVGFAAWLITGNDTTGATGSFVTHDIDNEYFTAKAVLKTGSNEKIVFGKPASPTPSASGWFSFGDTDGQENLTATFVITVKAEQAANIDKILGSNSIKVTLTEENGGSKFDSAKDTTNSKRYVGYPKLNSGDLATSLATGGAIITLAKADFTIDTENGTATADVTVTFTWGDYFTKDDVVVNPYTYFNGLSFTGEGETLAKAKKAARDEASKVMKAIHTLNGTKYDITLTVVEAS